MTDLTSPAPRSRPNTMAILAFASGAVLTLLYVIVKLLGPVLNADPGAFDPSVESNADAAAFFLGVLGILAILPAAATVVFGHLGLRRRADGTTPGRTWAAVGLTLGYVMVIMWANRLLVAAIASATMGAADQFVPNVFWWA